MRASGNGAPLHYPVRADLRQKQPASAAGLPPRVLTLAKACQCCLRGTTEPKDRRQRWTTDAGTTIASAVFVGTHAAAGRQKGA